MSTVQLAEKFFERIGDLANPILVKETRQALKSRQFLFTFLLLLLSSWVIAVFGIVLAGNSIQYGQAGRNFFAIFYSVLSVAILVVVPFGAFRSLLSERDENTWEVLTVTSLTPRQIVWGKLFSALVQAFLYYSAIAPFIAFTSLMQGFDFAQVVYLLVLLLIVALAFTMFALMMSASAKQRHTQVFLTLVVLGMSVFGLFSFLPMALSVTMLAPFDDMDFWIGNAFALVAFTSYFVLFLQFTTASLTFESDNRSSGLRITLSVQFWLFWTSLFAAAYYWSGSPPTYDVIQFWAAASAVHWTAAGMFAVTEPDQLSRRIQAGLQRSRRYRWIAAPFYPGGSRGLVYLLVHIVALWLLAVWVVPNTIPVRTAYSGYSSATSINVGFFVTALCFYVLIYCGLAAIFARLTVGKIGTVKPGHVRTITIIAAAFVSMIPMLIRIFQWRRFPHYEMFDLLNPFLTLEHVATDSTHLIEIVFSLGLMAVLVLLPSLRAMLQGITEIISPGRIAASVNEESASVGTSDMTLPAAQ